MADAKKQPWSVEFTKRCPCQSLFEPKYLRYVVLLLVVPLTNLCRSCSTHRAGGTKVLRCFPHCCPSHVYSSVCGSSVVVRVQGPLASLRDVVTYLRFDACYENPVAVGDTIEENSVLSNLRRQTHVVGEWIASHYEVVDENVPSRMCEFSPKTQSTLGWHYRWVGGSARQQRRAVHYLRAYVFAREPPRLRVLAVVESTPFIVMSYRRACKSCQRQSPEDERSGLKCQCEGIYKLAESSPIRHFQQTPLHPPEPATAHFPMEMTVPGCEDRLEDALATIHFFISTFPVSVLAPYLEPLDTVLRSTVHPPIAHPILHQIQAHTGAPSERLAGWSQTLAALGVVLGFSTESTPFLHAFSAAHASSLLCKPDLERSYAMFVQHHYSNVARALMPLNITPHALSDEILTLCAVLHAEHPAAASICLEKCRGFRPAVAFENFVAQMREIYMSFNAPPQAQPVSSNRPLDGCWRFRSMSIMFMSPQLSPSILSLMRASYMGLTFQIIQTSTCLLMRSHHSLTDKIWAEFQLDGTPQVHRVFPNGESSMACFDGLVHGDYLGEIVSSNAVALTLFSWPASPVSRLCYAIHIHIARVGDGALAVDVRVVASPEKAPIADYWCMTVHQRVATYDRSNECPVVAFRLDYEMQTI
ncbi:hypothetical protein AeRB84_000771 [Aphanomyces euteiches]|nr:hypothetical protein AeRB84_017672 [Aphanomyces euteiches]KAH9145985.1 hypothetical protein AeRB84_010097 [Aphanomyces euteiches]KAH9148829.1 hypothetical protein AeRB84_007944 [Aphanomyces euteiches]KAH9150049.1 hypothetical protein AeRB84_007041 [Aphanomyces euteiches]KAH9156843.1 hypothetical protein AeRB84_001294 [Aphanomyces euteiches]